MFYLFSSVTTTRLDRNGADKKCCVNQPHLVCYWNIDCASSCTNHSVSLFSNCPSSLWLDVLSPSLIERSASPTMLNIGANKGYDVRSFIERFDASWNVTGHQWAQSLIRHNTTGQLCGACGGCGEQPRWRSPNLSGSVSVGTVIAVEAEQKNAKLLDNVFGEHGLHFRDVRVVHAVATSPSARASYFVPIMQ